MKIGIVISTNEAETAWNALRFANFSLAKGHETHIFLIGKGVECEQAGSEPYNAKAQAQKFLAAGGKIFACGTCLKARGKAGSDICPLSTMQDLLELVEQSDKVVSF